MLISVMIPVPSISIWRRIIRCIRAVLRSPTKIRRWMINGRALNPVGLWRWGLTITQVRRRMEKRLDAMGIESKVIKVGNLQIKRSQFQIRNEDTSLVPLQEI
jgi:hypothetical protein